MKSEQGVYRTPHLPLPTISELFLTKVTETRLLQPRQDSAGKLGTKGKNKIRNTCLNTSQTVIAPLLFTSIAGIDDPPSASFRSESETSQFHNTLH